jgi:hypothetical protein
MKKREATKIIKKMTEQMDVLREKLRETNLVNAKLLLTNKLLQNSGLSPGDKARIIRSLDEGRTVAECKQIYERLAATQRQDLPGDTIVEVDEEMLRQELAKVRSQREQERSAQLDIEDVDDFMQGAEALKRIGFEKKFRERSVQRSALLKEQAAKAKHDGDYLRYRACEEEYRVVAKRYNESLEREKKYRMILEDK